MKIISVLTEKNQIDLLKIINNDHHSDGYELRLDYICESLSNENFNIIQNIINIIKNQNKIIIITLRDKNQGGEYHRSLDEKLEIYNKIANNNEEYKQLHFDFEYYINSEILKKFININQNNKFIISYHNFQSTPKSFELMKVLEEIIFKDINQDKIIYKIITTAKNSLDSFELIEFLKKIKTENNKLKLIAHCMGKYGEFSRVINGIYGSEFTYGFLNNCEGFLNHKLGCIKTEELAQIYKINNLNLDTKIYALIGDPVSHSIGHIFHNNYFKENNKNSVYIKINISEKELELFFKKIKTLNFYGLSITMPLKELVFQYISNKNDFNFINAVNTINVKNLIAANTDGLGACKALEKLGNIDDYDLLFIGAGGSVEGIINEIVIRFKKVNIFILNRTLKNAEKIKAKFQKLSINKNITINVLDFEEFENVKNKKLCVINAISNSNIKNNDKLINIFKKLFNILDKQSIFMDVNYYNDILDIVPNEIKSINGVKMFEEQAKLQQEFWDKN